MCEDFREKAFGKACSTLMLFEGHSGISLPGAHPVCDKNFTSDFRVSDDETDSLKCTFYLFHYLISII